MVKNSATSEKNQPPIKSGTLYIVAMPIGNREDITLRALSTLRAVDVILAEDTRHSLPLLTNLMIQKPLLSYHEHNEGHRNEQIIEELKQGKSFALISDAGTPLISDPGFSLVRLAREKNLPVIPIPGACAVITALSAAGISCNEFTFVGFLPAKTACRKERLNGFQAQQKTVVAYESSHRIIKCVQNILEIYGDAYEFVLAKELTKIYEHFIEGSGKKILDWLQEDPNHIKGEFVLILPAKPLAEDTTKAEEILKILLPELSLKQAVSITCQLTKANKNSLYQLALNIK